MIVNDTLTYICYHHLDFYLNGVSTYTKSKGPDDLSTIPISKMFCGWSELRLHAQSYAIQFLRPLVDQSCPVNLGSSGKRLVTLRAALSEW